MQFTFSLLLFLFSLAIVPVQAAKPTGLDGTSTTTSEVFNLTNPVEKAQELLKGLGLYQGNVDGKSGSDLENAIRLYQGKHGLEKTGKITRALLEHMSKIVRVQKLIFRLDEVRQQKIEKARVALLSNPKTRKLLEEKDDRVADPTRDASMCFEQPTPQCLLREAVESSRAVYEDDLRDWALGEILAAQVTVGLNDAALKTAARIKDSRLVIAALSNIAKTYAQEGLLSEAYSSLTLIPVPERKMAVMLEIAKHYQRVRNLKEMEETLNKLLAGSEAIESFEERYALQLEAIELLADIDQERALRRLDEVYEAVKAVNQSGARNTILRHIANVMAHVEQPEWAMRVIADLPDDETRAPVLMAIVRSFLGMKKFHAALDVSDQISSPRYHVVIAADIALALWRAGQAEKAQNILDEAEDSAQAILLPYAKSYAYAQLAKTYVEILKITEQASFADKAQSILKKVRDHRIKAQGLWELDQVVREKSIERDLDVSEAMNAIKSKFSKAWILADLARAHQQVGETSAVKRALEMGLETARDITNPWARSRVLARFGEVLHRSD